MDTTNSRLALNIMTAVFLAGLFCVSISAAQDRPFTMVFLALDPDRPVLPQEEIDSLQTLHMANIQKLADEGKLVIAGPFDSGGGLFVMSTVSRDTANMWLNTDPAVRSKRWMIETYPYVPSIGGICVVAVKYEMVTYTLVRFTWTNGNMQNRLISLLNRDAIVGAGVLEGSGSVVVLRGEVDENSLKNESIVRQEKIGVSVRKLWIAKGSFCED